MKYFIILFICFKLFSKESLYLHFPSPLPSDSSQTAYGKALVALIKNSKREIIFAIYGLRGQNELLQALIDAKSRGVKIKGVVDSDSHGKNYYTDTDKLYKYFEIASDRKSHIMHNKFFVFDKEIVWSGSSNISDTGTGGYNANNVVVLEDKKIASLYIAEFEQMFYKKKFSNHKNKNTHENIKTKDSIVSIYFSPKSNTYENSIKELVRYAKSYIYIPIFYLTHKELAYELEKARDRGVDIKIILDATAAKNKYSMHKELRKKGINTKVENFGGKMHCKSMIVDDTYIVSGSMNFSKAGNKKNDENSIIIKNQKIAKEYKAYFLKLWESIPDKYLHSDPNPESFENINSCIDGIDNDFDKQIDAKDNGCKR